MSSAENSSKPGDKVEDQVEIDKHDDIPPANVSKGKNSEAVALRAASPPAMRLSRKAIGLLAAVSCICIAGTLIYALRPKTINSVENIPVSHGRIKAETIASAPDDYSEIPKLGAPLTDAPKQPLLAAQQQPSLTNPGRSPPSDERLTARQQERERQRSVREAALSSRLFLASAPTVARAKEPDGVLPAEATAPRDPRAEAESQPLQSRTADTNGRTFLAPVAIAEASTRRVANSASPYVVQAGNVIPAALITGIRSDLPGLITAQVTENVYDSPSGRILLIPQGSRLIGEYDSATAAGQQRILIAWDRLIFPNSRSILLDRLQGADQSGRSGLQDGVDNHWAGLLGAAFISTLLNVGTEVMADDDGSLVRALRYGTQDSISQAGRQIIGRQLTIPPTLTIRPGHPLRVMVKRDIILEPWEGQK